MQTCPGVFRGNDIAAERGYELQLQSLVQGIKCNMLKKQEMLEELREVGPCAPAEWEELMDTFSADAHMAPATSHGAAPAAYKELCLNNPNFLKKGPYVRQSTWWSFVQAAENYDPMFSTWRYTLWEVAKRLVRSGADLKALEKEALQQLHMTTVGAPEGDQPGSRQLHQKQLAAVRAAKGNQIVLAPMLMHNLNFFNMRVMLLASRPFWSEQTLWAVNKTTPAQGAGFSVAAASGQGEAFLREAFRLSTFSASEWGRLGADLEPGATHIDVAPTIDPLTGWPEPGVTQEQIPQRAGGKF